MKVSVRNRNAGKYYADGKKKPPNWEWRFYGAKVGGKRKEYCKSGFRTKKEAEVAGAAAAFEYSNSGSVFTPDNISVQDFLYLWLEQYGETNLKETTLDGYRKVIKNHILPSIGHYYLKDLSSQKLQELINQKFNEGYGKNRMSSIKGVLTKALEYAVEPGHFIARNPMVYVKLPNPRALPETPTRRKERRPVTDDEWNQIIARFPEGHVAHLPLLLAYRCGLRLGECFGGMWEDVDFEKKTLRINRQIQYNNTKKCWEFTPPKYDSYRIIAIDDSTLSVLQREHDKQLRAIPYYADDYRQAKVRNTRPSKYFYDYGEICEIGAEDGAPIHMIMSRECGDVIHPRITQHVARVIHGKESGPAISEEWDFHSLRHTHASKLLEANVPMQIIQERLGHASIDSTNIYTHATENMNSDFRNVLNGMFE